MLDKGLWLYRKCFLHVNYILCTMHYCKSVLYVLNVVFHDVILTSQYSTSHNETLEVGGYFSTVLNVKKKKKKSIFDSGHTLLTK